MDQVDQQSQQSASNPETCRDTICRYSYSFYSCFSDYFECDRRLLPISIIPYQVYHLKEQNPLIGSINKNNTQTFQLNRIPEDSMLAEPQQQSRWSQMKTCDWWKTFLCCPYPEDQDIEMETDYDHKQSRFAQDQKRLKAGADYFHNNQQKIFAKGVTHDRDAIIFLDDEMHDDGISVYEMQNNDNPVILIAQPVKVNQRQQLGDIGIKRKSKTNSKETNSHSGGEIVSPILKSKVSEQSRKISSDFTLCSSSNIPKYPNDISNPNSRVTSNIITQSFDQSQSNHYNIKNMKQGTDLIFNEPKLYLNNPSSDQIGKRKKRNINPFEHQNDSGQNYDAVQEKSPEDMSKKKRKRRKDVHQDQKEKDQRANKREKEDMQVVIFQEDQM